MLEHIAPEQRGPSRPFAAPAKPRKLAQEGPNLRIACRVLSSLKLRSKSGREVARVTAHRQMQTKRLSWRYRRGGQGMCRQTQMCSS